MTKAKPHVVTEPVLPPQDPELERTLRIASNQACLVGIFPNVRGEVTVYVYDQERYDSMAHILGPNAVPTNLNETDFMHLGSRALSGVTTAHKVMIGVRLVQDERRRRLRNQP